MKFKNVATVFYFAFAAPTAHADCYKNSFPEIQIFADNVLSLDIETSQYIAARQAIIGDAALILSELDTNDTSLSLEHDLTDNLKSLNLNADLSFWKHSARKEIIKRQSDIKKYEIYELENSSYTQMALAILSIISSETYLSIFEKRNQLLLDQLGFYEKRIAMGSSEFQKKLEIEQEIIALENKKMSAEIKKQTSILTEELNIEDLSHFKLPLTVTSKPSSFKCAEVPKVLKKIDHKINLLSAQIAEAQHVRSPRLLGSVSSIWDENNVNDISGKLVLNIPIYGGNKKNLKIEKLEYDRSKLEIERTVLLHQLQKVADQRNKVDQILMASLNSLDKQIASKNDLLSQVNLKQNLGASIFEEKIQIQKEISILEEARVSLIANFYEAWLNFMSARGDLSHDTK